MPRLDTDFSFNAPDFVGAKLKGMQIGEHLEDRAWQRKQRGWSEEDRTRTLERLKFKDELDALNYIDQYGDRITYDNYAESKQHLEDFGLNPDLMPPIESFGPVGSDEARKKFEEYKKKSLQTIAQKKAEHEKALQTQRDTAAMKRVEAQQKGATERQTASDKAAMEREKLKQRSATERTRIRKAISESGKLTFAEKEQYKYLIGRLEKLDEKMYGEFAEDLTDDEMEKLQLQRNEVIDGLRAIENKAQVKGTETTSTKTTQNDMISALTRLKEAGVTKADIQTFVKANPNATIDDMIKHFEMPSELVSSHGKFDAEGSGYDYESAIAAGLKPDETGHWPSRDPKTGLILKGKGHETWDKTVQGEADAGYNIVKKDDRYYSEKQSGMSRTGEIQDVKNVPSKSMNTSQITQTVGKIGSGLSESLSVIADKLITQPVKGMARSAMEPFETATEFYAPKLAKIDKAVRKAVKAAFKKSDKLHANVPLSVTKEEKEKAVDEINNLISWVVDLRAKKDPLYESKLYQKLIEVEKSGVLANIDLQTLIDKIANDLEIKDFGIRKGPKYRYGGASFDSEPTP